MNAITTSASCQLISSMKNIAVRMFSTAQVTSSRPPGHQLGDTLRESLVTRHDPAHRRPVEVGERQVLQVIDQAFAQVVLHPLAQHAGQVDESQTPRRPAPGSVRRTGWQAGAAERRRRLTMPWSTICLLMKVNNESRLDTIAMQIRKPTTHRQCGRVKPAIRRSVPLLNVPSNSSSSNMNCSDMVTQPCRCPMSRRLPYRPAPDAGCLSHRR